MRKEIAVLLGLVAFATKLHATDIDLGAPGSYFDRSYTLDALNGTTLDGQTVTINLVFNNSIHLFANTFPDFDIGLQFQTNDPNIVGFITGTGTILDINGNPMCALRPLASGYDETGGMGVGLFPLFSDKNGTLATDITRPLDFYGARFNLTLPHNSDFSITEGGLTLTAVNFRFFDPFRIGPHVPHSGSTITLFALALIGLLLWRTLSKRLCRTLKQWNQPQSSTALMMSKS